MFCFEFRQQSGNVATVLKTNPSFRYDGKTGEEHTLVILQDTSMSNYINGELSARPFY